MAIVQAVILWVAYTFFFPTTDSPSARDLETFGLYGSIILSFTGSFMGGLLKRGLDRE